MVVDYCIENGLYRAKVIRCGFGHVQFRQKIHYVFIDFTLTDPPHSSLVVSWRGSLTEGAIRKTAEALLACGARLENGDVADLEGVGQRDVLVELETVESPEAPGTFQVFVVAIRTLTT